MAEKQDLSLFGRWYSHYITTSINQNYSRTVTSYRIATEMESNKWKTFRQTWIRRIDRSFDQMFFYSPLYNSAAAKLAGLN